MTLADMTTQLDQRTGRVGFVFTELTDDGARSVVAVMGADAARELARKIIDAVTHWEQTQW